MAKLAYRKPTIVDLGAADTLIRLGINGDICDGTPCTGNYRYFYDSEKGLKREEITPDHEHDPKKPLVRPGSDPSAK
jgi:hypothetical protein